MGRPRGQAAPKGAPPPCPRNGGEVSLVEREGARTDRGEAGTVPGTGRPLHEARRRPSIPVFPSCHRPRSETFPLHHEVAGTAPAFDAPARRAQGLLRIASASCRRRVWSDGARSSAPVSASCAPPAPRVSALPPASSSFCGRTPAPGAGSFQRRAVMPSRDAVPFAFPFCSRARIAGSCTAEPELASGFTAGSLRPPSCPRGNATPAPPGRPGPRGLLTERPARTAVPL